MSYLKQVSHWHIWCTLLYTVDTNICSQLTDVIFITVTVNGTVQKKKKKEICNLSARLQPCDASCDISARFMMWNISTGVEERLPWRGGPHGDPDGRLGLHHGVRAERAISRMLAEHVQAAQLLLPHLWSHRHPGEKLPRELSLRWESASSSRSFLYSAPLFKPLHVLPSSPSTLTFPTVSTCCTHSVLSLLKISIFFPFLGTDHIYIYTFCFLHVFFLHPALLTWHLTGFFPSCLSSILTWGTHLFVFSVLFI